MEETLVQLRIRLINLLANKMSEMELSAMKDLIKTMVNKFFNPLNAKRYKDKERALKFCRQFFVFFDTQELKLIAAELGIDYKEGE